MQQVLIIMTFDEGNSCRNYINKDTAVTQEESLKLDHENSKNDTYVFDSGEITCNENVLDLFSDSTLFLYEYRNISVVESLMIT